MFLARRLSRTYRCMLAVDIVSCLRQLAENIEILIEYRWEAEAVRNENRRNSVTKLAAGRSEIFFGRDDCTSRFRITARNRIFLHRRTLVARTPFAALDYAEWKGRNANRVVARGGTISGARYRSSASRFQLLNMRLARPPEWPSMFYREETFRVVCFGGYFREGTENTKWVLRSYDMKRVSRVGKWKRIIIYKVYLKRILKNCDFYLLYII